MIESDSHKLQDPSELKQASIWHMEDIIGSLQEIWMFRGWRWSMLKLPSWGWGSQVCLSPQAFHCTSNLNCDLSGMTLTQKKYSRKENKTYFTVIINRWTHSVYSVEHSILKLFPTWRCLSDLGPGGCRIAIRHSPFLPTRFASCAGFPFLGATA